MIGDGINEARYGLNMIEPVLCLGICQEFKDPEGHTLIGDFVRSSAISSEDHLGVVPKPMQDLYRLLVSE